MIPVNASTGDDFDPRCSGPGFRFGILRSFLKPDDSRSQGNQLFDQRRNVFARPKHVHDLERTWDLPDARDERDGIDPGQTRIDSGHFEPLIHQIPLDPVGGAVRVGTDPDHGDFPILGQDVAHVFRRHRDRLSRLETLRTVHGSTFSAWSD